MPTTTRVRGRSKVTLLRQALRRVVGHFDGINNGWPTLLVSTRRGWVSGQVDDELRDALHYARRILQETQR